MSDEQPAPAERRRASVRRDLNDIVRDPGGKVSEAKVGAVAGKGALLFILLTHTESVIKDWMILTVFVTALIAPDLFKKVLAMRAGLGEKQK